MSKKRAKKKGDQNSDSLTRFLVLVTATLNLAKALVDLLSELLG